MDINFLDLRLNARLSRQACADYFRVNLSTVNRWDHNKVPAPFAVCELLRVIAGKFPALSRRSAFDGWSFGGDFVYTPEGDKYTPEDIKELFYLRQLVRFQRGDIRKLTEEVKNLTPDGKPIMQSNVLKFPSFDKKSKQG